MERAGGWWLLCLSLATACGGRSTSLRDEPVDSGNGTAAGSTGKAGGSAVSAGGSDGPGETDACRIEKQNYADYREQLLAQFSSFGCGQDSDCVVFYNQTTCDSSCVLSTTAAKRAVVDGLNNYALSNCSSDCLPKVKPDCGDPPPPHCFNGQCVTAAESPTDCVPYADNCPAGRYCQYLDGRTQCVAEGAVARDELCGDGARCQRGSICLYSSDREGDSACQQPCSLDKQYGCTNGRHTCFVAVGPEGEPLSFGVCRYVE